VAVIVMHELDAVCVCAAMCVPLPPVENIGARRLHAVLERLVHWLAVCTQTQQNNMMIVLCVLCALLPGGEHWRPPAAHCAGAVGGGGVF
jgi:hypothetical protein